MYPYTHTHAGVGHYESVSQLTQVSLNNEKVSSIHTYADTSFALTGQTYPHLTSSSVVPSLEIGFLSPASGRVYGWGNNEYGQLGIHPREKQV